MNMATQPYRNIQKRAERAKQNKNNDSCISSQCSLSLIAGMNALMFCGAKVEVMLWKCDMREKKYIYIYLVGDSIHKGGGGVRGTYRHKWAFAD